MAIGIMIRNRNRMAAEIKIGKRNRMARGIKTRKGKEKSFHMLFILFGLLLLYLCVFRDFRQQHNSYRWGGGRERGAENNTQQRASMLLLLFNWKIDLYRKRDRIGGMWYGAWCFDICLYMRMDMMLPVCLFSSEHTKKN